jgi:hypothetical protein
MPASTLCSDVFARTLIDGNIAFGAGCGTKERRASMKATIIALAAATMAMAGR